MHELHQSNAYNNSSEPTGRTGPLLEGPLTAEQQAHLDPLVSVMWCVAMHAQPKQAYYWLKYTSGEDWWKTICHNGITDLKEKDRGGGAAYVQPALKRNYSKSCRCFIGLLQQRCKHKNSIRSMIRLPQISPDRRIITHIVVSPQEKEIFNLSPWTQP